MESSIKETMVIVSTVVVGVVLLIGVTFTLSYIDNSAARNCRLEALKLGADIPSAILLCKN